MCMLRSVLFWTTPYLLWLHLLRLHLRRLTEHELLNDTVEGELAHDTEAVVQDVGGDACRWHAAYIAWARRGAACGWFRLLVRRAPLYRMAGLSVNGMPFCCAFFQ